MVFRALFLLAGLAGPALAEAPCLTAVSLAGGVTVTMQGGTTQHYRAKGRDVVARVAVQPGRLVADLVLARGLHVVSDLRTEREPAVEVPEGQELVGGNDGGTITTQYAYGAAPKPGMGWQGKVSVRRDQDGPSIGPQPTIKGKLAASVTFLPEETVTLSGCAYRIRPMETVLTIAADSRFTVGGEPRPGLPVGQVLLARRQIWFPDLGFAVLTRERGVDSGWSEDWQQGIVGLAAD